ncbi:MAG: tetratricopeptide repeat protein [bacterium]
MTERLSVHGAPTPAASAGAFVATFVGIILITTLLLSFDLFLARIDRRESAGHAASEYRDGVMLLAGGKASDAVEHFAVAVSIDRGSVPYTLGLAEAMIGEDRIADAEATLKTLLDRAENDGAVNLAMARVMRRENRPSDATAYYHRAIFGRWNQDSLVRRMEARFELIDLLAQRGAARELLAELLPLEATSPDSVALRRRLGQLFIEAGSPARAANMFRDVLRRDPLDVDAYAGMGEAALAVGNFRAARADLAEALRLRPTDARIADRLAIADTALTNDPAARGLSTSERYARSRALLRRTMAAVESCPVLSRTSLADSARVLIAADASPRGFEPASDVMLAVASDLWTNRPAGCAVVGGASNDVLRFLQNRLTQ